MEAGIQLGFFELLIEIQPGLKPIVERLAQDHHVVLPILCNEDRFCLLMADIRNAVGVITEIRDRTDRRQGQPLVLYIIIMISRQGITYSELGVFRWLWLELYPRSIAEHV